MKSILLKENNYSISDWSGGKTRELSIFPHSSKYADREFIWRLSSATVDLDESDFTMLPDYNRVLMVLKGSVVLTYDDVKTVNLNELEQDSFDGASKTKSYGRITDFNLMVRKGNEGILDVIRPESSAVTCEDTLGSSKDNITHALYCKEGYFLVNPGTGSVMVRPGETFLMEEKGSAPAYTIMGNGVIIRAQIGYDYDGPEEEEPETPAPETKDEPETSSEIKASSEDTFEKEETISSMESAAPVNANFAEDFKWSMFLANTQFRGAKYIFKKIKNLWYDELLTSKIRSLERLYVTFIVFLLGILVVMASLMNKGLDEKIVFIAAVIWLFVDCLVVSPLIYYLALPKPIAAHIKNVDELTDAEMRIKDKREKTNERVEKLLKRYEKSGRVPVRERERDDLE